MQSAREAVDNLMRKKKADHVPLHDSPWGDAVAKWITQGMPKNEKGEAVDCADHFGFDMIGCGGWFDWYAKRGVNDIIEENDEWKVVRNGNGAALKWWKNKSGTPEHIDFQMSSRAIWEKEYRPHLAGGFDRQRLGDLAEARKSLEKRKQQGKWSYYGHQFIWENLRASLGDTNMFMALVDDPGWIHDFNRVYTDLYKAGYRILLEEVGKPDGIWIYEDLGYRDRLFCSPAILEELIFPYYTEVIEFFHGYDLPVILHSCGFQEPMIPLAIKAGFDGLNPMEVKAGNNIFKYAEKFGDKLAFVGGFDARILENGDHALIRREVQKFMRGMKERGARFLFGSDHSVSTNVTYDAFRYALEVYREEMMY